MNKSIKAYLFFRVVDKILENKRVRGVGALTRKMLHMKGSCSLYRASFILGILLEFDDANPVTKDTTNGPPKILG